MKMKPIEKLHNTKSKITFIFRMTGRNRFYFITMDFFSIHFFFHFYRLTILQNVPLKLGTTATTWKNIKLIVKHLAIIIKQYK